MMNLKSAFEDNDRAVSPVIGVILMVAITVILAAVIGTFVLGLGDSLENEQPQAQLNVELSDGENSNVNITHRGGDSIETDDLNVTIAGGTSKTVTEQASNLDSGDRIEVGDEVELDNASAASSGDSVVIIHTPSDSIILDREL